MNVFHSTKQPFIHSNVINWFGLPDNFWAGLSRLGVEKNVTPGSYFVCSFLNAAYVQ